VIPPVVPPEGPPIVPVIEILVVPPTVPVDIPPSSLVTPEPGSLVLFGSVLVLGIAMARIKALRDGRRKH
jgi:hypothetical protein